MPQRPFLAGQIYRHPTRGLFEILGTVRDSSIGSDYREMVHFRACETGEPFVRDAREFDDLVEWPDGARRPRFILEPPTLEAAIADAVRAAMQDPVGTMVTVGFEGLVDRIVAVVRAAK